MSTLQGVQENTGCGEWRGLEDDERRVQEGELSPIGEGPLASLRNLALFLQMGRGYRCEVLRTVSEVRFQPWLNLLITV